VIGVARDTKYNSLGESTPPFVYLPFAQRPRREMILQLAVDGDGLTVRNAIWEVVRRIDPSLPPPPVRSMADDVRLSLLPARLGATLLGALGLVALLLATAGVYGVTSFSVAQRTREIGIRSALGARRGDILLMVVGDTMRLVAIGMVVGAAGAVAIGRAASGLLYGVNPGDPRAFLVAPLFLCVVALVASFIPARRAAAVHPIVSIRGE
jgi:putative ABC transport system permease protein